MKKVIITVGTSLIEKNNWSSIGNESLDIDAVEIELNKNKSINNNSAEMVSIEKLDLDKENDEIYLIATDTSDSVFCAKMLQNWLKDKGYKKITFDIENKTGIIDKLQVYKKDDYEIGLENLLEYIIGLLNNNEEFIFNITGGYKGVIPYLTIIAQIINAKIVYLFEESEDLLDIPNLPINFDDQVADLYMGYLNDFVLKIIDNNEVVNKLQEMKLIYKDQDIYKLTALGKFFKEKMNHKPSILGDLIEYMVLSVYDNVRKGVEFNKSYGNGDIDILIENDSELEIIEIKSFAQIKKFLDKQADKYVSYLRDKGNGKEKKLTLLVYLVDNDLLKVFVDNFQKLQGSLDEINFTVKYIELPLKNLQSFLREFKQENIKNYNYERITNV
jgi:putative CRISPR-associated protein (TIGR02619 family)